MDTHTPEIAACSSRVATCVPRRARVRHLTPALAAEEVAVATHCACDPATGRTRTVDAWALMPKPAHQTSGADSLPHLADAYDASRRTQWSA